MHVVNGDSCSVGEAGLGGDVVVYADVLHDGPVLLQSYIETRARFLADAGLATYDEAVATLSRWETGLQQHADYDDVVIWVEHDLFDQLLLIKHLAFLADVGRVNGVWLVQADDYLGHMSPAQLAALFPARVPVSEAQRGLAVRAWRAFTGADPCALQALIDADTSALPHLRAALLRQLEEYPSSFNGLGRLDNQILTLLAERARTPHELFAANAALEQQIYLGDATFFWRLKQLEPLVEIGETVRITDLGRDVVAGKDALGILAYDRWFGGVHLNADSVWRWDGTAHRITPCES